MANTPFRRIDKETDMIEDDTIQVDDTSAEESKAPEATVDSSVLDELDPEGVVDLPPVQAEDTTVIFVPLKDFEGRVNDLIYNASKGVPVKIPRDVANIWLEDESRGYVRD